MSQEDYNNTQRTQQDAHEVFEETLVKYGAPVQIEPPQERESFLADPLQQRKKPQLPPLDQKPTIEEILNSIFPPKKWQENGEWYEAGISCDEASRVDLQELEETLDYKLRVRQARKSGICPVREDLHNQLFDEIIRQSTINCPERGLLLLRVRENLRMTFAAYQTLYQGSIVFGVKKAKQAEEGQAELENKCEDLKKKKIFLQNRKIILENEFESLQKSFKEIREIEEMRRKSELTYLTNQTKHLDGFLKNVQQSQHN